MPMVRERPPNGVEASAQAVTEILDSGGQFPAIRRAARDGASRRDVDDDLGRVIGWRSIAAAAFWAIVVACSADETVPVEEAAARVRAHPVPADQERGKALYAAACSSCHGAHGEGSEQGPPMLHPLQARMHGDFAFERAVREGVQPHHYQLGTMPPVEDLGPGDVDGIVAYVRWMQEVAGLR